MAYSEYTPIVGTEKVNLYELDGYTTIQDIVDLAVSGGHDAVTLAGSLDYITISGQ